MSLATKLATAVLLLVACHLRGGSAEHAQLLVTCYPKNASYYEEQLPDILNYLKELDTKVKEGGDELIILYKGEAPELTGHTWQHAALLQTKESWDLWMRDFTPTVPEQQASFVYKPSYLEGIDPSNIQGESKKFFDRTGITLTNTSPLVVDGGNIVDNGVDKAIMTERILKDNSGITKEQLKADIAKAIKREILLIPDAGDTTGHSDKRVLFLDKDTLMVGDYGDPEDKTLAATIRNAFPAVKVTMLPSFRPGTDVPKFDGFDSAVGTYSNAIMTDNCIYFPQFDNALDQSNVELIKNLTEKTVVTVDTAELSKMGGSVRGTTWQIAIDHPIATRLLELVKTDTSGASQRCPCNGCHILLAITLVYITSMLLLQ